ncbi:MAG: glucosyltransferase domain-containing protein [Clostridia bacterium]
MKLNIKNSLKKIKEVFIKNKENIIIYCGILIFSIFILWGFLSGHYATDTYNIINRGYEKYAIDHSLSDGRVFMAIIGLTAHALKLPILAYVVITTLLAIIVSCFVVMVLYHIIIENKQDLKEVSVKSKIIAILISYVTIFNFMYIENMYFVESIVMAISILLYLLAANILVKREKNYIIKSSLLVVLGLFCYQGTIGFFLCSVCLISFLAKKNWKKVIGNIIIAGYIVVFSVLVNMIQVAIFENLLNLKQERIGNIKDIPYNIFVILRNLPNILAISARIYPKCLFIIFMIVLICIISIYLIRKNKNNILEILFLTLFSIATSFSTQILSLGNLFAGRVNFSIGATIGVIFAYAFCRTKIFENRSYEKYCIIAILFIYFTVNACNYKVVINESKKINVLEKKEVEEIEEYMKEHEKENNIKIDKICYITEKNSIRRLFLNNSKYTSFVTYNAVHTKWSFDGAINLYSGRNLQIIEMIPEAYELYIDNLKNNKKRNDYFCLGDTLCVVMNFF